MKKIRDERLKLQNLKNIRISFIVQTLGILIILVYDLIKFGRDKVISNPLWLVFLISGIVSNYLNISISVDYEKNAKNPNLEFAISLVIIFAIAAVLGYFIYNTASYRLVDALIFSGIIIISGLIPSIYLYKLRKERNRE